MYLHAVSCVHNSYRQSHPHPQIADRSTHPSSFFVPDPRLCVRTPTHHTLHRFGFPLYPQSPSVNPHNSYVYLPYRRAVCSTMCALSHILAHQRRKHSHHPHETTTVHHPKHLHVLTAAKSSHESRPTPQTTYGASVDSQGWPQSSKKKSAWDQFSNARYHKAAAILNPSASALVGRKMGSLTRVLPPVATRSELPRV